MRNSRLVLLAALVLVACQPKERPKEEPKAKVPMRLFEVQLGKRYTMRDRSFEKSDLPVRKFTGAQQAIGSGTHFYFQPQKSYDAFAYLEKKKNPQDAFFETSYRIFMLPVIPPDAKTVAEVERQKDAQFEVLLVEWSRFRQGDAKNEEGNNEDYFWAQSMCKTFEADLGVPPKVNEQYRPAGDSSTALGSFYTCTFTEGDRELEVSSLFGRSVKLSFANEVTKSKIAHFETQVRKLQAPAIRPY